MCTPVTIVMKMSQLRVSFLAIPAFYISTVLWRTILHCKSAYHKKYSTWKIPTTKRETTDMPNSKLLNTVSISV